MCTVTIIPVRGSVRLACNRDELRSRPAALLPVARGYGARKAIMPIDPVSDGTWIAVNDSGIAATLLNVNVHPNAADTDGPQKSSRGVLIPRLMACATVVDAEKVSAKTDPRQHSPFRLVLVDDKDISQFWSDGYSLRYEREALGDQPHLFTSSGLGDALVERPRRELFEQMFATGGDWVSQQDAFHRHSWPDRRHLSVCMEREEARTVSHTLIEIEPGRVAVTYVPDAPDRAQSLAPIALPRLGANE
ncbi:MAG TPA: NRDE family protein [Phycisphaerae bacterium]|nr:NRDE family protein [Phycisphaerae bacterium]